MALVTQWRRPTSPVWLRASSGTSRWRCARAFPDCDIDPSHCQAHHIITWEHHGETALNNLVLLCPRHLVHEGHRTVTTSTDLDPGHPHHVTFHPPRTQLAA